MGRTAQTQVVDFGAPAARPTLLAYRHPAASDAEPLFDQSKFPTRVSLYALMALFDLALIVAVAAIVQSSRSSVTILTLVLYAGMAMRRGLWSMMSFDYAREYGDRATLALGWAAALAALLAWLFDRGEWLDGGFASQAVLACALLCFFRPRFASLLQRLVPGPYSNDIVLRHGPETVEAAGSLVVTPEQIEIYPDPSDPHMLNRIGNLFRHCDRVILDTPVNRRAHWIEALSGIDVDIEVVASEHESHRPLELRWLDGNFTLLMRQGALRPLFRAQKRLFDLAIGVPLILLLSPVLLAIAIAIRLESPGPALFRQRRVGCGNRQFDILKFRTMHHGQLDMLGARSAAKADERVTRVGKFLRKTSLDELPQLINVLSGEMSLVGPRPHALGSRAGDELFWDADHRYWERHAIKPGITGLAQVRGFRGATATPGDIAMRVQADIEYIATWSIMNDLAILLRTLRVLIHERAF